VRSLSRRERRKWAVSRGWLGPRWVTAAGNFLLSSDSVLTVATIQAGRASGVRPARLFELPDDFIAGTVIFPSTSTPTTSVIMIGRWTRAGCRDFSWS